MLPHQVDHAESAVLVSLHYAYLIGNFLATSVIFPINVSLLPY